MFHFISKSYISSKNLSRSTLTRYQKKFNKIFDTASILVYTQSIAKRSTSQLAADAAAFVNSVKLFGSPEKAKQEEERKDEVATIRSENETKFFSKTFEQRQPDQKPLFWPKLKLQDFRKEAITFIETFYFQYKSLPSLADFVAKFSPEILPKGPADWEDFLVNIQEPLQNRGIPAYEVPLDYLEPNFVLAVNLIVNPYDKRAVPAKLKEAGLSTKQWQGFLRQDKHQEYYRKRLDQIFDEDTQNDAKLALQRLIQAGDLQAIKHYHELQNIYRPSQQNNQIQLILMAIMEILTLHVPPEIIGKVAESLRSSPQLKAIEVNNVS
jgi:hypothetical protein